jgi:hypothetical protein
VVVDAPAMGTDEEVVDAVPEPMLNCRSRSTDC